MKALVTLWDWVRTGNETRLRDHVHWRRDDSGMRRRYDVGFALLFENGKLSAQAAQRFFSEGKLPRPHSSRDSLKIPLANWMNPHPSWRPGEVVQPARQFIYERVSDALQGRINPTLLFSGEVWFSPTSLLAALYVLFLLELSGQTVGAHVCEACGKVWIPKNNKGRFCSGACRVRAWSQAHDANPQVRAGGS